MKTSIVLVYDADKTDKYHYHFILSIICKSNYGC